jgi:polysaccharide export outer membrane protein
MGRRGFPGGSTGQEEARSSTMRNQIHNPFDQRWAVWRAALGILALFALGGCGGSARSDVDLNSGTPLEPGMTEEQIAELDSAFPLMGGTSGEPRQWTYRIAEGDQLEMVFFSHPDQNRFVTVRPECRITMPYLGEFADAGKAPTVLATELKTAYAEVLVAPQIDVIVQTMGARYYVFGEVTRAGEFEYERPIDLMQAIAQAGGYNEKARLSSIVILRKGEDGVAYAGVFDFRRFLDAETRIANIEVRPDDLIWVPKSAIARWDTATSQTLSGVLAAEDVILRGWQIAKFDEVYQRVRF